MKKIRINNDDIFNIVKKTVRNDRSFVNESKIDKIIKNYLVEREDLLLDDEYQDNYGFSEVTKETLGHMVEGLRDTVEDLDVIKTTEDVIQISPDVYSEEYLENIVSDLESVIERLEFLKALE